MLSRLLAVVIAAMLVQPAAAMVGGAPAANGVLKRHVVVIVGSKGSYCTGVALAPRLVLTAAHCVLPGATYKLVGHDAAHRPELKDITAIVHHPQFSLRGMMTYRGTADLALAKLAAPMAGREPAALGSADEAIKIGDRFIVAGYGITDVGDPLSGGVLREAQLVATGRPDSMDVRLMDPTTRNRRAGLGACTGDSGGPVFRRERGRDVLVGLIGWTTGPDTSRGCGGLTGMIPLARYHRWIVETARKLGAALR